jgi:hypothetical protein
MDKTVQSHLANFWWTDRQIQKDAFTTILQLTAKPVDCAQDVWDELLTGLQVLLEHNIHLNLIADRFPNGLGE